jgi:hypothetical protein
MDLLRFIQGVANRRSLQHSTSTPRDDRPELYRVIKFLVFTLKLVVFPFLNYIGTLVFAN